MASPWVNPREGDYWGERAFNKQPGWHSGHRGGLEITFYTPTALDRLDHFFYNLASGGMKKIGGLLVSNLAGVIKAAVGDRYRELARGQTRSAIGKLSFQKGKDVGAVNPARLPRSEVSGYTQLANAIRKKAEGNNVHLVYIDGGINHMDAKKQPFTSGVPLPLLAYWIENSTPTLLPVTARMAAYLRMLREGRGGYRYGSGRHISDGANKPTGKYIVVVRPDRPVWRWVVARLLTHGMQVQATDYVSRQIDIVRAQYGLGTLR